MSRTISIANKLSNEPKFIEVVEGKVYKVDDRKNTIIKMNEILSNVSSEIGAFDDVVKLLLGDKAYKEIEAMELPFGHYQNLFIGLMALASDKEFEELEKQFRDPK